MSNCLSCSFSINITSIMCRLGHILYSSSWAFINFFSFQILHKTAGGWFSENTHDTHREDAVHQNKACPVCPVHCRHHLTAGGEVTYATESALYCQ